MATEMTTILRSAKIGALSLRAGAATAMFLAGVPAETIQLIGSWQSQTSCAMFGFKYSNWHGK